MIDFLVSKVMLSGRSYSRFLLVALLIASIDRSPAYGFNWIDQSRGLIDLNIVSISTSHSTPTRLFCASPRYVFVSDDCGESWYLSFRLPGEVKDIVNEASRVDVQEEEFSRRDYDEDDLRRIGIVQEDEDFDDIDDSELFRRLKDENIIQDPEIEEMERVSQLEAQKSGSSQSENDNIIRVVSHPTNSLRAIIISVQNCFITSDGGVSWRRIDTNRIRIQSAAFSASADIIYFAALDGLYFSDLYGTNLQLAEFSRSTSYSNIAQSSTAPYELSFVSDRSLQLLLSSGKIQTIELPQSSSISPIIDTLSFAEDVTIATTSRMIVSYHIDAGWNSISTLDLRSSTIRDLISWNHYVFAATDRGVFLLEFDPMSGRFINSGLMDLDVQGLTTISRDGRLCMLAATRSGVYLCGLDSDLAFQMVDDVELPQHSLPPLSDIIRMASDYHEINLQRSSELVASSRSSAWLPEIDVIFGIGDNHGVDYSRASTISTSGGVLTIGPDDETYSERDLQRFDGEIRLRWFPAKLSFSNDQIACQKARKTDQIQARKLSKKVTLLYSSLVGNLKKPINRLQTRGETKSKFEEQLEIDRLVAELDALTGSFISKKMTDIGNEILSEGD